MPSLDDFQHWYRKGIEFHNAGLHEKSVHALKKALKIKPNDGRALYNLANVLVDKGMIVEAIEFYNKALEVDSTIASVWYNKANAHLDLGEDQKALEAYDTAISLNSKYVESWFNRGIALQNLKRTEEAISSYTQTIQINPSFHQGWFNLACLHAINGNLEMSLDCLKQAIEKQVDDLDYRKIANIDHDFDIIRDHPEFKKIIEFN